MKMHNRLLALFLSALMVCTMAAPGFGAVPFPDVPADHWAYDAIEYLANAGLIEGYPDGTFGGSRNFTRYEMALVFQRIVQRFEQYVDERIAQGINTRLEDLTQQVAAALREAAEALKTAKEAKAQSERQFAAAMQAVEDAKRMAQEALDVAVGTLEAIDAMNLGTAGAPQEALDLARAAIEKANQALEAIEAADVKATSALEEARNAIAIAVGTLDAIDAQGWGEQIDGAYAELAALAEKTAQALAAAQQALDVANAAMDVAIGTLDAIDARGWDAMLEEALSKADRALALAERIAVPADEAVPAAAAPAAPVFTDAARQAIEEIAARVVMDQLQELKQHADRLAAEVGAIRTDLDTARALITSEANRLEGMIQALMNEFRTELEMFGVRVASLEAKFAGLEDKVLSVDARVTALEARLQRYRLTGFDEAFITFGGATGNKPYYIDPRNRDAGTLDPANRAGNRIQLRLDGEPNDEVRITAFADLTVDARLTGGNDGLIEDARAYLQAQTDDRPLRLVRVGSLDADQVAANFHSQVLGKKALENNAGAFLQVATPTTTLDLFGARNAATGGVSAGFNAAVAVGDNMDLKVGVARLYKEDRTAYAVAADGAFEDLVYSASVVNDVQGKALNYDLRVTFPFENAKVQLLAQRIHLNWSDDTLRFPLGEKIKQPDDYGKIDPVVAVNEPIYANQALRKVRVDLPVGSFNAFAQFGQYTLARTSVSPSVPADSDNFTQIGLYDLNLFGFDVKVTQSRFTDAAAPNTALNDLRTTIATQVEDIKLTMDFHRQSNNQPEVKPGETSQSHMMLTAEKPVQILVPLVGTLNFGNSFSTGKQHFGYKLALKDYELVPDVTVSAELSAERNVIDGNWRQNASWTDNDQTTRAVSATWRPADPLSVSAGYKEVNNTGTGKVVTQDAGIRYKLSGAFGGDLTLGYDYRLVRKNGVVDGTPRNILSAVFSRTSGGLTVDASAKRYIGGTVDEKGNEYDTTLSLDITYPVFKGADLRVNGKYVSSLGTKADEYQAGTITAGLRFSF